MAISRREDYGRRLVNGQLEELEDKIASLYTQATYELDEKLSTYFQKFEKKDSEMLAQLAAGEITDKEYTDWRRGTIIGQESWFNMRERLAQDLTHSDEIAAAMINDTMPSVYSTSYNFGAFMMEEQSAVANVDLSPFTIYNEDSVKILMKDDPDLLPSLAVDRNRDLQWNREHIQSAVAQGVIQGDSMDKIADRLQQVTAMDKNAAIRNARTATNGVENAGRQAAADRVVAQGIPMVKRWSCVLDARTRESHLFIDGEEREENEHFSNGLMYAGDPSGDPSEVYNCRCATQHFIKGIDHSNDAELYDKFMQDNYYDDWLRGKEAEADDTSHWHAKDLEQEYAAEKQARLRGEIEDTWDESLELPEPQIEAEPQKEEKQPPVEEILGKVKPVSLSEAVNEEFINGDNWAEKHSLVMRAQEEGFISRADQRQFETAMSMRDKEESREVLEKSLELIGKEETTIQYGGVEFTSIDKNKFDILHDMMNTTPENERLIYGWDGYVGTGNSFRINRTLREEGYDALSADNKQVVDAVMDSINSNTLQGNAVFVRNVDEGALASIAGISMDEAYEIMSSREAMEEFGQAFIGSQYREKQLVSCSTDATANVFTDRRVQLQMLTPEGTPVYFTNNTWESEAIQGIGTNYNFVDSEVGKNDYGDDILILRAIIGG